MDGWMDRYMVQWLLRPLKISLIFLFFFNLLQNNLILQVCWSASINMADAKWEGKKWCVIVLGLIGSRVKCNYVGFPWRDYTVNSSLRAITSPFMLLSCCGNVVFIIINVIKINTDAHTHAHTFLACCLCAGWCNVHRGLGLRIKEHF